MNWNQKFFLAPIAPVSTASAHEVKTTKYFDATRQRDDRSTIDLAWIEFVIACPQVERIQADGRIRRWTRIEQFEGRWLRVVLLPDGETVHNAFFDRRLAP